MKAMRFPEGDALCQDEPVSCWWLSELAADPAYSQDATSLLVEVLDPQSRRACLDLVCGERRIHA